MQYFTSPACAFSGSASGAEVAARSIRCHVFSDRTATGTTSHTTGRRNGMRHSRSSLFAVPALSSPSVSGLMATNGTHATPTAAAVCQPLCPACEIRHAVTITHRLEQRALHMRALFTPVGARHASPADEAPLHPGPVPLRSASEISWGRSLTLSDEGCRAVVEGERLLTAHALREHERGGVLAAGEHDSSEKFSQEPLLTKSSWLIFRFAD